MIASLFRCGLLPIHLFREYRISKALGRNSERSLFDRTYGVETDGDIGDRTYLSDLTIESSNWAYGKDYSGIVPERFFLVMARLNINFEDYVFIDFGSGKGRALLLASDLPFRRILGIEFSRELHAIAKSNIRKYVNPNQKCTSIESVCMDFTQFQLPPEPCVLYFFDPSREKLLALTLENIQRSLKEFPRPIYVVYVSPVEEHLFDSSLFLRKIVADKENWFSIYQAILD